MRIGMDRLCHSATHLANIFRFTCIGKHPRRVEVGATLVGFRIRQLLYMVLRRPLTSANLLGTRMHFAHPSNFYFLGTEIFVDESYRGNRSIPTTILDCGSNIGMSILYFKSIWPGAHITGVEAAPDTFEILQKNVKNLPDVVVLNRAVSDRHGTIPFYSSISGSATASVNAGRGGGSATLVEAIPMSELVTGPVDLLKIDIEGAESDAFAELESSGKMGLIREMFIEYHHHMNGEANGLTPFLDRLGRCGFDYVLSAESPEEFDGFQDVRIWAKRIQN